MGTKKTYGRAADIWSLGCMIYNMVTGIPPFYDSEAIALDTLIKHGRYAGVFREYDARASKEVRELIENMIQVNPKDRMSAGDLFNHPWIANA